MVLAGLSHLQSAEGRQAVTQGDRGNEALFSHHAAGESRLLLLVVAARFPRAASEDKLNAQEPFKSLLRLHLLLGHGQIKPPGQLQIQGWIKRLPLLSEKGKVLGYFCNLQITKSKRFLLWDLGKSRNRKDSFRRRRYPSSAKASLPAAQ